MPNIPRLCSDCHESLKPKLSGKGKHIVFSCPTHGPQAIRRSNPLSQEGDRSDSRRCLADLLILRLAFPAIASIPLFVGNDVWEKPDVTVLALALFAATLILSMTVLRWLSRDDARRHLLRYPTSKLAKFVLKYT